MVRLPLSTGWSRSKALHLTFLSSTDHSEGMGPSRVTTSVSMRPPRSTFVPPPLTTTGALVNDGATLLYRGSTFDCRPCKHKDQCCPNTPARKIPRSIYERARDVARALTGTPAFEQSKRERKRIEMLFAHLKRILRLGRLRLRGPSGARDEFLLAATVQNLRKLAKLVPTVSIDPTPA